MTWQAICSKPCLPSVVVRIVQPTDDEVSAHDVSGVEGNHDLGQRGVRAIHHRSDVRCVERNWRERLRRRVARLHRHRRGVAAQVEIESEVFFFFMLWIQALSCRRFQGGFDRANLHRPTEVAAGAVESCWRRRRVANCTVAVWVAAGAVADCRRRRLPPSAGTSNSGS